jgi:hypothetical protein
MLTRLSVRQVITLGQLREWDFVFLQMLQLQWDYGYQRACQALGVGVSLNAA